MVGDIRPGLRIGYFINDDPDLKQEYVLVEPVSFDDIISRGSWTAADFGRIWIVKATSSRGKSLVTRLNLAAKIFRNWYVVE